MEREILFIQGAGEGTYDEWDSKLVSSLRQHLGQHYGILYPRMPDEGDPSYESWQATLEELVGGLSAGAILVGHSFGGTVLVRLLSERSMLPDIGGIILISAPFVGDGGWSADEMQFPPDFRARIPGDVPVELFHGLDDEIVPPIHMDLYAEAIPQARVHRLPGRDHQLNDDLGEVAAAILAQRPQH